ncbi:MFS transporter [Nitriliruptoraceae bacterium ZYF776]|nr:MFS transporter [Profundirhabdus halotolerans]
MYATGRRGAEAPGRFRSADRGRCSTALRGRWLGRMDLDARPPGGAPGGPPVGGRRATAVSVLSTVQVSYPLFVVAALAPALQDELGLTEAMLGAVVAAYFLASSATSVAGGRVADALGWRPVVAAGSWVTAAVVLAGAVVVRGPSHLLVLVAVVGVLNGLTQPAATEILTVGVPPARQGRAFGAKHAAVPGASLLAGLAVPTLAGSWGWRPTMAAAAVATLPLVALLPRRCGRRPRRRSPSATVPRVPLDPALVLVSVAAALGAAAANAVAGFVVVGAVATGMSHGGAGWLLSGCSVACIVTRVVAGLRVDRTGRALPLAAGLLGVGVVGHLLLASAGTSSVRFTIGAVVAFAGGWGWTAVLGLGVVREFRHSPAAATGVLHVGAFGGGLAGPLLFGGLLAVTSYRVAWAVVALLGAAGAGCLLVVLRGRRPGRG